MQIHTTGDAGKLAIVLLVFVQKLQIPSKKIPSRQHLTFSCTQDSGQWTGHFTANDEDADWDEHQRMFDLQMEVRESPML
jgi:hypothetical protein